MRSNENFPGSGAGRLLKILRGLVNRIHDSAGDTIKPAPRGWRAGIPEVTGRSSVVLYWDAGPDQ